ncbi:MAG: MBL fold metallo-hydrolase [Bacteroidales bacterium]|nr:MBL fold metallo-hydrolase [Bacteroidales bacterium]
MEAELDDSRTLIVLGCGTSMGVPMIGCECGVCTSTNPRNHRTRSSVLLRLPQGNLLIDTTPEMRLQLVREKIPLAHAVLYTHYHSDHLLGLDDARLFSRGLEGPVPIFCCADTEEVIRQTFSYAFHPANEKLPPGMVPSLEFHRISNAPIEILGQTITPIPLVHGRFTVFGFRFDNVAYCTDVSLIPDTSWPLLEGLDVLIIDALRPGPPHPSHFNLAKALEAIARLQPKQAYLTHMSHEFDYDAMSELLPDNVAFAYDGLRFDF